MPVTEVAIWNEDGRWNADLALIERFKAMIRTGQVIIASTPKGMLDWPQYRDDCSESSALAWEAWQQQTVKEK